MSARPEFKGDYMGFTYGTKADGAPWHSSDLGIVRVSDGSRFNENLLPTMQDKTVQVPGGDGTYYFGTYYTQRQFSILFAFDDLTEAELAELKRHFSGKEIRDLIFDETPYKTYHAKVTGTATMKYIPFGTTGTRVYKGDGVIQFTCYQPYATCTKKWLSEYADLANLQEWSKASGLKQTSNGYDTLVGANSINLYNPGDIETHFQLTVKFQQDKIPAGRIYIDGDPSRQLKWSEMTLKDQDNYVKFNSKLNLIEGYTMQGVKSGNVYNQYINAGAFFKIPLGESTLKFEGNLVLDEDVPIEYYYYYF